MKTKAAPDAFIYRWATSSDIEHAVATMQATYNGSEEHGLWTRMLMDGSHASANAGTVAVAEQRTTGKIAAVIATSVQIWYYAGIPLKALNVTLVGTHPAFQGRGLVTNLMKMIHESLAAEQYDLSLVWGKPWFYKQYGYYQTLGNRVSKSFARTDILAKWGTECPYVIRHFQPEDIPFAVTLHLEAAQHNLVSFPYDDKYWKMFVFDYFEENRDQYRVIEKDGEKLGIFVHNTFCDCRMSSYMFDLVKGASWLEVLPWVTGYLLDYGDRMLANKNRTIEHVTYSLREGHPVYEIMRNCFSRQRQAEQNYYRITDMTKFLRKIAPVLEQRVADSFICGYTRRVTLQLFDYKQIIAIIFKNGRIMDITWEDNIGYEFQDLHMPLEYFMHLLFGQKDIEDFLFYYREVGSWNDEYGVDNEIRILFKILFPKKPSFINHPL